MKAPSIKTGPCVRTIYPGLYRIWGLSARSATRGDAHNPKGQSLASHRPKQEPDAHAERGP